MSPNDFPELPKTPPNPFKPIFTLVFWVLLPLGIGLWLSSQYVAAPAVGLIHLETDIWAGSAEFFKMQLAEVRADDRVKAVVVIIDSPGGEVAPTQDMYFELVSLQQQMPVVGSINSIAASGGYYLSLATDPVYAKPNSTVGNVGVWGFVPSNIGVNEVVLASGPFKLTASNNDEFLRNIERIKQEFLQSTANGRGDRLVISLSELSQGLAYSGRTAVEFGMIDHLGSQTDAIAMAAELAGIQNYDVIDMQTVILDRLFEESASAVRPGYEQPKQAEFVDPLMAPDNPVSPWFLAPWLAAADPATGLRALPPGVYLLYDVRIGGEQ